LVCTLAHTYVFKVGQFTEQFDVNEDEIVSDDPRLIFIQAEVNGWDYKKKELYLSNNTEPLKYDRLCIATGANPLAPFSNAKILTIRDTESAEELQRRLKDAKHVAVVGNGGIATEVVFEMRGLAITWIIRDESISSVFFNPSIAEFLLKRLKEGRKEGAKNAGILRRLRYAVDDSSGNDSAHKAAGCALGPDWISTISFEESSKERAVDVIRNAEVVGVKDEEAGLTLQLSNNTTVQCDFAIWATGVVPAVKIWKENCDELNISPVDGGIVVDDALRTSIPDVYACGDVCTPTWSQPSEFWKQIRLWTQARQMGDYCARSMMANGDIETDICFELFTHTTTFFGYKVVFLGDFKGEHQPEGWYTVER
ncbi:pyridine nucleotide-disulfide oxidoreductase, partial [Oesophagostomum dentatum]